MENNKNTILALILSGIVLVGFQYLYIKPQQEHYRQQVLAEKAAAKPAEVKEAEAVAMPRDRAEIIKDQPRVPIVTPQLYGSVNLVGARLDDLQLAQYRDTVADNSPNVTLLSPAGSATPHQAYYADFSWLSDQSSTPVPTAQTAWKTTGKELSPQNPLILTWDNGQGLGFERTIAVDDQFMFTVTDRVTNKGSAPVTLFPFGRIARQGNPVVRTSNILHEGPLGVINGTLEEYKYKKLMDDGKATENSEGGWLGITDKYWLVAMVPPQKEKVTTEFAYNATGQTTPGQGYFQSDFRGAGMVIAPNASIEHTSHLFAGAKRQQLLDDYEDKLGIPLFDRAIDFGWFWFLTIPFLHLLDFMGHALGSFGLAILAFTVLLKVLTLPLSLKSYHSMARMKAMQPEMKRIQERYADDKMRQSQEMMSFYKREKVNPMAGCVPQLIQIPIFFALYKVLYVGIELRQAPFYGWIKDMSVPDPTSVFTAFGTIPITLPSMLNVGVWPILMGLSMFMQQRLSPQPPDKSQARMFMFMPIMFTFMLAQMPAGLVVYWTWSNLLGILQQWYIMKQDARKKVVL